MGEELFDYFVRYGVTMSSKDLFKIKSAGNNKRIILPILYDLYIDSEVVRKIVSTCSDEVFYLLVHSEIVELDWDARPNLTDEQLSMCLKYDPELIINIENPSDDLIKEAMRLWGSDWADDYQEAGLIHVK